MSRIDTPRGLAKVPAGMVPIAGVAWAQTVGIAAVEVKVDDGGWQPAELADGAVERHVAAVGVPLGRHARAATPSRSGRPTATAQSKPTSAPNPSPTVHPAITRSS